MRSGVLHAFVAVMKIKRAMREEGQENAAWKTKVLRNLLSGYNHVGRRARGVSHAEAQTRCWMLWGGTWGGEGERPEGEREGPRGSGNCHR